MIRPYFDFRIVLETIGVRCRVFKGVKVALLSTTPKTDPFMGWPPAGRRGVEHGGPRKINIIRTFK
jgi:hypothetical protein